tara:strand:- start:24 stop:638 length:615 start_codon:yes stop_codon:yes gene_type:complete
MAEKSWYYAENGERKGPVSESEAARLAQDGTIGPDTLVWSEGMQDWAKAATVLPTLGGTPVAAPPPPPGSGQPLAAEFQNAEQGYHPNGFQDSVRTVFKRYALFQGRSRRPEFWWFVLFSFIANLVASMVDLMLFGANDFSPLSTLFSLAVLVPSLAVGARRLHDTGRSGWWQLLGLIPIIGWIILIIWLAKKGDEHPNEYGPA